jgi:hypothetical protein
MIMNAILTDKTAAEPPWAGLHPSRAGPLNMVQKTLSALLAHHLRKSVAELIALDHGMFKDIGLDRREIGSVLVADPLERTNRMRRKRRQDRVSGE